MKNMVDMTVAELLIGRAGTGVGRAEAAELAARYSEHAGDEYTAKKHGGIWWIVSDLTGERISCDDVAEELEPTKAAVSR